MIEDEFSKVALRNAIKYFKPHSENDCVGATVKVMEYSLTKKEVPKPYQTLLKEGSVRMLNSQYHIWMHVFLCKIKFLKQVCFLQLFDLSASSFPKSDF